MTNRKGEEAQFCRLPPQVAPELNRTWEAAGNYTAGRNWKQIGGLANGVVRRVRFVQARH